MAKTHQLIISNVNIFTIMNLYNAIKFHRQLTKLRQKFRENIASSGFNYKVRQSVLTVHKPLEHDFWQN